MEYIINHYGTTINRYHNIFYKITGLLTGVIGTLAVIITAFTVITLLAFLIYIDAPANRLSTEGCPGLDVTEQQCQIMSVNLYKVSNINDTLHNACINQMKIFKKTEPWDLKCTMTFMNTYIPAIVEHLYYLISLSIALWTLFTMVFCLDDIIREVRSRFNLSKV